jgi:hypothetical protein
MFKSNQALFIQHISDMAATQCLHRNKCIKKNNENKQKYLLHNKHKRIKNRRLTTERLMSTLRKCH